MRNRGIAVPEPNLNIVLLSWLRAGSKPAAVPAAESEPPLKDVDEPTPMPTALPSPHTSPDTESNTDPGHNLRPHAGIQLPQFRSHALFGKDQ